MSHSSLIVLILAVLLGMALTTPSMANEPATQETRILELWDGLLEDHVRLARVGDIETTLVDYAAISRDARWPRLLRALETAEEPTDVTEKIAFWSNAYNIMAIKVVLTKYPVNSIRDLSGWFTRVWDIDAGVVAGEMRTLTEIEHEILRHLGDARIHAAIVCAALSCPPLRMEAFRAEKLDEQFDDQMRVWLANEKTGAILERDGSRLRISNIFRWFSEDFEAEKGTVLEYIKPYLPDETRESMRDNVRLAYLSYDWSLNDLKRAE